MDTIQLMHEHVREIYRALTGQELSETPPTGAAEAPPPPADVLVHRFAEMELAARSLQSVAARVPPFFFVPPLDVIDTERELIVEAGVPGIDRGDVKVEVRGDVLVLAGTRAADPAVDGRSYYHAEMPRGPFRRVERLPYPIVGEPRVEVERGVIRVRLSKPVKGAPARA